MSERNIEETAVAFNKAAKKAKVDYALIGAFASSTWGRERATQDIDCIMRLLPELDRDFAQALEEEKLKTDEYDIRSARNENSHLTIHDTESSHYMDCIFAKTSEQIQQINDAVPVDIGSGILPIARPEDTIVYKLKFGGDQQKIDAENVLRVQGDKIDFNRLVFMSERAGVTRQLNTLLRKVKK